MTKIIFPTSGNIPKPDVVSGETDNRTNTPKPKEISKIGGPFKSVTSNFDDSIFLINERTGTQNKSISFTREEMFALFHDIQKFLGIK